MYIKTLSPICRFYNEQDDRHPGTLIWSAKHLYPLVIPRGVDPATVRPLDLPLVLSNFYHIKIFDLENEEDLKYYCWVMDRVSNGWFMITYRREEGNKIRLEWIQPYYQIANVKMEQLDTIYHQNRNSDVDTPLVFDYPQYLTRLSQVLMG